MKHQAGILILIFCGFCTILVKGQQSKSIGPSSVTLGKFCGLSEAAISFPVVTPEEFRVLERRGKENRFNEERNDNEYPYSATALPVGRDHAWQNYDGRSMNLTTVLKNFQGLSSPLYPPDANGAVGPDHYVQTVNCLFSVYNKNGEMIMGPILVNYFFQGAEGSNCNSGDPIILYDEQADRWILAEMSVCNENDVVLVAISMSGDPTGSWYRYAFETDDIPDYEKLGIWRDGYYMGTNTVYDDANGDPHWEGDDIYVMQRSQMLNGLPAYIVGFDNPWRPVVNGVHCVPPLDNEGQFAAEGTPGLFITFNDDAVGGGTDQLWIYELAVDWADPYASSFNRTQQLDVIPFSSDFGPTWENIVQPGTAMKLHAFNFSIMNRPQYRNFGSYQSMVCCHTVDVNGLDQAGIRWYELQKTSGSWYIRQQGTYAPDGNSRWLGSVALNGNSEIGLAYSISSSSVYPGIRFCGQSSSEYAGATGIMDISESTIQVGAYSHLFYRWGDYADLGVDPSNDEVFWFTSEYIGPEDERQTKIASFLINTTALHADFSADNMKPAVMEEVQFTDLSIGSPYAWNWTVSPSGAQFINGTSSSTQNPVLKFTSAGNYTIKLVASGTSGIDSITKYNFISTCGINSLPAVEEFSSNWLPACWELANLTGEGLTWDFTNPMGRVLNSTTSSNGIAVCDAEYNLEHGEAALETPALDFSGYSSVSVYFEHYLYVGTPNPDASGFVYFSTDGGETWTALAMWASTTTNPNIYDSDVSWFLAGQPSVKFRWVYNNNDDWYQGYWAIDDIWIYGTPDEAPVADFYANDLTPEINSTVIFTDHSSNSPYAWYWSISPADYYLVNGTNNYSKNPQVVFLTGGFYDVSLTVYNTIGTDDLTKLQYIYATTPGLWKGTLSSDWNTPLNWDSKEVPDAAVVAIIPETAPNWPIFSGIYIVGYNSAHLVMMNNSVFTIDGTLYNYLNRSIVSIDSSLLRISNGFYNYGTLVPGYGTIEFYGANPSYLAGTDWNDMSLEQYSWNSFEPSYSGLSEATPGPSGDDASLIAPIGFTFFYCENSYTQVNICTNGWCSLDQSGGSSTINEYLFLSDLPNTTLAPWWDDLNTDGVSSVRYKTEGFEPNRVFSIEWYRMLTYWTAATSRITFQLRLYEGTNSIEFHYGEYESGSYNVSQGASIGIEDEYGGQFHYIEGTTGSVYAGISTLQSAADWPGLTGYRFIPPPTSESLYKLKVSKSDSFLQIDRDINVTKNISVESRSSLNISTGKNLITGE